MINTPQKDTSTQGLAYDAVVFDLLTALIDSWILWDNVAGSEQAGRRWRGEYLKLTYGAGVYRPYTDIVADAAKASGMPEGASNILETRWGELTPWPGVGDVLEDLSSDFKLGVVTNCSIALGNAAALNVFDGFDAIVTAEDAGFYKPRPEPYRAILERLGTQPERTLFVAGSAADVPGASGVGMTVYWHNRIGLSAVNEISPAYHEQTLDKLPKIARAGP